MTGDTLCTRMRSNVAPSVGSVMVTADVPPGEVSGGGAEPWSDDFVEAACAASSRSGIGCPEFVAVTDLNLSALLPERQGSDISSLAALVVFSWVPKYPRVDPTR